MALCSHLMQVACALLMSGEKLEDHIDVKNILIDMGIYFQVQVSSNVYACANLSAIAYVELDTQTLHITSSTSLDH